jgi:N-acetyl-beta-hexosaminidase
MEINGLMIDCARLLELPQYYYWLLEFMAEWKMNTLILHFSDDHGCALNLPGFEKLAMPRAWEPDELQEFLSFAASRGIEVIPELETFGHTRYITDKTKYQHLSAGKRTNEIHFNAINPLHEDTLSLMSRLIQAVASAFPSKYIHIGCDEVDIDEYCQQRNLVSDIVWADYANRMIQIVQSVGKTPMIWADHVVKRKLVASRLHKDVVLVEWRYDDRITDDIIPRLQYYGFKDILVAPSLACYSDRFLPSHQRLENNDRMIAIGKENQVNGLINTIWCPWRSLPNAMHYGIVYSAWVR